MIRSAASAIKKKLLGNTTRAALNSYFRSFERYSFEDCKCTSPEQFEASIIRLYHTIEKGLSYREYRPGFGGENVEKLIVSLRQYAERGYDTGAFFYETALSCLHEYLRKNQACGWQDAALEERIRSLPGYANECGGTVLISEPPEPGAMSYRELMTSRRSIRHFSDRPVALDALRRAIELAQYTPSACNRQGWRTRIVADKDKMRAVLENQNGNRGFGHEFDKLLVVTADLRMQQKSRELFQAFVDGGMYAENVLNALYDEGIGATPLSAALTPLQEKAVRKALRIDDSEVIILFIGVGRYPEGEVITTRSERKPAEIIVI